MRPLVLIMIDLPERTTPQVASLNLEGRWTEAPALADAGMACLLTGAGIKQHGALSQWELRPDGQNLRESPRHRLMQVPIWERLEGAIAVGVPWSIGSHAGETVVSTDFARIDVPGKTVALPERLWPASRGSALAPFRLAPDELDGAALIELGFSGGGAFAQTELATFLSLHAIATALLSEERRPPLAIVRLGIAIPPTDSLAAQRLIGAVIERYQAINGESEIHLLLRQATGDGFFCQAFGTEPGNKFDSAHGMGLWLHARFNLNQSAGHMPQLLDDDHWRRLRERYAAPTQTLPGTRQAIDQLQASVDAALALIQGN